MPRLLVPLPDHDFDTTEVVVPWKVFRDAGFEVVFATATGATPACDPLLLSGVIFGALGARPENVALYRELEQDPAFRHPVRHDALHPRDDDRLHLPGGHAQGMRPYLESEAVQALARRFFEQGRPVGAICHGVIVLARAGLLVDRSVTALPAWMELSAWALTAWKLGRYYRTYDETVQAEVTRSGARFQRGPLHNRYDRPFVVQDDRLVTARWPGDAQAYAEALLGI